ncbi:MAG: hypothetical protein HZA01_15125 [Nitrospinae bacterium]|nr:hypothetical protein [Nitrospinota bacterium]
MNSIVRASKTARQRGLAGAHDVPVQDAGGVGHESLERSAQLVFRPAGGELAHLGRDRFGEALQGFMDSDALFHAVGTFLYSAAMKMNRGDTETRRFL